MLLCKGFGARLELFRLCFTSLLSCTNVLELKLDWMLEFTTSIRVLDNRGAPMKNYEILSLKLYQVEMKIFQLCSSIDQDSYTFSCHYLK
jgi:hypothetical protein